MLESSTVYHFVQVQWMIQGTVMQQEPIINTVQSMKYDTRDGKEITSAFLAMNVRNALGIAPCMASMGLPLLKAINVGITRMPTSWAIS